MKWWKMKVGGRQSGKHTNHSYKARLVNPSRFKLHLRPKMNIPDNIAENIPPLPAGKTETVVLADFLRYLYQCAKSYIRETHISGTSIWESVENQIEFILTHPNGWEGAQQNQMRQAAVNGGLIPDTVEGRSRVHFVTEGEASLHFCVCNGLATESLTVSLESLTTKFTDCK